MNEINHYGLKAPELSLGLKAEEDKFKDCSIAAIADLIASPDKDFTG